jgi:hypothetical protein
MNGWKKASKVWKTLTRKMHPLMMSHLKVVLDYHHRYCVLQDLEKAAITGDDVGILWVGS